MAESFWIVRPRPDGLRASRTSTHRLYGALAQLVERLLCKQDVNGSNPLGSTIQLRQTRQKVPT